MASIDVESCCKWDICFETDTVSLVETILYIHLYPCTNLFFYIQVGVTPCGVEIPRSTADPSFLEEIQGQPLEHRATLPTGADPKWRFFWRLGSTPSEGDFEAFRSAPVVPQGNVSDMMPPSILQNPNWMTGVIWFLFWYSAMRSRLVKFHAEYWLWQRWLTNLIVWVCVQLIVQLYFQ